MSNNLITIYLHRYLNLHFFEVFLMTFTDYLNYISKIHNSDFSLKENYFLLNETYNLFGYSKFTLGRTFISQKDIIDRYDSHEYILLKYLPNITENDLNNIINTLPKLTTALVKPDKFHKSTYITYILATDSLSSSIKLNEIKNFKDNRVYKWYFQGFSEVRLLLIDLSSHFMVCNKPGQKVSKMYLPAS